MPQLRALDTLAGGNRGWLKARHRDMEIVTYVRIRPDLQSDLLE